MMCESDKTRAGYDKYFFTVNRNYYRLAPNCQPQQKTIRQIRPGTKSFQFSFFSAHGFHFAYPSRLSRTRNMVILRIKDKGSGFSRGNWMDPLAVLNFERVFSKAFT